MRMAVGWYLPERDCRLASPPMGMGLAPSLSRGSSVEAMKSRRLHSAMKQAVEHPLLSRLGTLDALRVFCRFHVFAVWDFMLLLQATRKSLAPPDASWLPPSDPVAARSLSQIAFEEESGVEVDGRPASHFELYVASMDEFGAPTGEIRAFTAALADGCSIESALAAHAPAGAREFCLQTLDFSRRRFPERLAALTFARENLTSPMFRRILRSNPGGDPSKTTSLRAYLDRHIEVDGDEHSIATRGLIDRLGDNPAVYQAACEAVEARIRLWEAINAALPG